MDLQTIINNNVDGSTTITLDTATVVPVNKTIRLNGERQPNPHYNRITKHTKGLDVIVFQNKNSNGYEDMVKSRLIDEGKDPDSFRLSPRQWGERLIGTPFVTHNGKLYLEVILMNNPPTEYRCDGKVIEWDDIHGMKKQSNAKQGGLANKVILRTFNVESINQITIDGETYN